MKIKISKQKSAYKRFTRSKFVSFLIYFILVLAGLFTVLPLIYSVCTSFKPLEELLVFPPKFFVQVFRFRFHDTFSIVYLYL